MLTEKRIIERDGKTVEVTLEEVSSVELTTQTQIESILQKEGLNAIQIGRIVSEMKSKKLLA